MEAATEASSVPPDMAGAVETDPDFSGKMPWDPRGWWEGGGGYCHEED